MLFKCTSKPLNLKRPKQHAATTREANLGFSFGSKQGGFHSPASFVGVFVAACFRSKVEAAFFGRGLTKTCTYFVRLAMQTFCSSQVASKSERGRGQCCQGLNDDDDDVLVHECNPQEPLHPVEVQVYRGLSFEV